MLSSPMSYLSSEVDLYHELYINFKHRFRILNGLIEISFVFLLLANDGKRDEKKVEDKASRFQVQGKKIVERLHKKRV
jgi:hypothetical protein